MRFGASFIAMIVCIAAFCLGIKFHIESLMIISIACMTLTASIWSVCEALTAPIKTVKEGDDE